jgi:2-oxoglutarate dehydrogenase E2 component (dihydrolipoamide succinyltransferase)
MVEERVFMATDVVMPQMGESIFEGTVTKWLKKPGDRVERDEPLFEISTDKVDAEIPSPVAGVLSEIKVEEGSTVGINTIVAVIGESGGIAAPVAAAPAPAVAAAPETPAAPPEAKAEEQSTDVVMPQMGESIFEGTITKWLKQVGDKVERDEPLFEISTDKVDAEIPSPVAGVLSAIKVEAGTTAQINTVVAVIGGSAKGAGGPAKASVVPGAPPDPAVNGAAKQEAAESGEKLRSSPLVRRIAKENDLDLGKVPGSGSAGRITKEDVLAYLDKGPSTPAAAPAPATARRCRNAWSTCADDENAFDHRAANG